MIKLLLFFLEQDENIMAVQQHSNARISGDKVSRWFGELFMESVLSVVGCYPMLPDASFRVQRFIQLWKVQTPTISPHRTSV
jgi:hypothetical protein